MESSEVRSEFLSYFERNGHTIVSSSSLIPKNDPTLLFTNAGMVQFKDVFLGFEQRPYSRATSCQKCVRAGGKHNDLENVGHTPRHHTFFEMLGNFSFGDYFKNDAIRFGWELLTDVYGIPKDRLWVSVHEDDEEAYNIWRKDIGVHKNRLVRLGDKDNFWAMGETGPCGYCSEIYYNLGEGSPAGGLTLAEDPESERYLEVWNLVFMQYDRDSEGRLSPLPKPSIDTGMGLERLTSILQGVRSNYDTDLFRGIINRVEEISGLSYGSRDEGDISMRVVADHSRAVTFLVSDGVLPSNEGRGYVLRRILRRAVRHLRKLGVQEPSLHLLTDDVRKTMEDAYTELPERLSFVQEVLRNEEERFFETIDRGLELLSTEIEKHGGKDELPGGVVFKLYDTFGFPLDLTEDIARESGLGIDQRGFEAEMDKQRERSRKSWRGSDEEQLNSLYKELGSGDFSVVFTGYDRTEDTGRIAVIIKDGSLVDGADEGDTVEIITHTTPFYGEAGGQVGDRGVVEGEYGTASVLDTLKPLTNLIVHVVRVDRGKLWAGDVVSLRVDGRFRQGVRAHHTSTHILHAVLREVLGDHVHQAGSLVDSARLRFDFSHFASIDEGTVSVIEELINERLRGDDEVVTVTDVPYDEAIKGGAMAIFEEKYGDRVRVVNIGDYSKELCGGIHLSRTGELGLVKIVHETSSSAGVRRIEALAGEAAWKFIKGQEASIHESAGILKVSQSDLVSRVKKLVEENERYKKEHASLVDSLSGEKARELLKDLKDINGVKLLSAEVKGAGPDELRKIWDDVKESIGDGLAVLGSRDDGKAYLLVGVSKGLKDRFHAGRIVKELAPVIGGGGGGRHDMAQAGGSQPDKLPEALSKAVEMIKDS